RSSSELRIVAEFWRVDNGSACCNDPPPWNPLSRRRRTALGDGWRVRASVTGGAGEPPERPADPVVVLDGINKAIIEQLQQDGRRSYSDLAKVVGLSDAAVRQRVQRLTDAGVIQVVAVTDPLTLGFAREAFVGIRA